MWELTGSAVQDLGHRTGSVCTCRHSNTSCQQADATNRVLYPKQQTCGVSIGGFADIDDMTRVQSKKMRIRGKIQ